MDANKMFGEAIGKAKQFVSENPDKVKGFADKAGDFVDEKTGGKYHEKIDKAVDSADNFIDKQH